MHYPVAQPLGSCKAELGEGPLWHAELGQLFWFDIQGKKLFCSDAGGSHVDVTPLPFICSAAAIISADALLIAAENGFYRYEIDSGKFEMLAPLEAALPNNRSNDGRCDPWGRFWVGTMAHGGKKGLGALYKLDHNLQVTLIKSGLSIPNSIAFSPDKRRGYFSDSAEQTIYALNLDPASGEILEERVFLSTKGSTATPDGSVVDAEGFLWNAQWDAWRVVRYDPHGHVDRIVSLPVQRPTCPAFGGKALNTLFVTSAYEGLERETLHAQPFAGCVFQIQVGITGQQEHTFIL